MPRPPFERSRVHQLAAASSRTSGAIASVDLVLFAHAVGDVAQHAVEDLRADFGRDEAEHDDVVADAVQDLGPRQRGT